VLTVLAVGVWMLALAYAGTPGVLATVAADAVDGAAAPVPDTGASGASGAPFVTYPLRWYVSMVHHEVESGSILCKTTVAVINLHTASVTAQLEFYDSTGTVRASRSSSIAAGGMYYVHTTDLSGGGEYPQTGTALVTGHGRVYADHPNVLAFNYVECPTGAASVTSFPVGATLELFRAGLPTTGGMPPFAEMVDEGKLP
jgi:hypothetical protein